MRISKKRDCSFEIILPEKENTDEWVHTNTDRQTGRLLKGHDSFCVCVYDGAPVCVSFQSVHASVPLIILIWLCLLLSCLVGDKAEGPSLAHSLALYYRAGWATQDWAGLPCSQAISSQEETRGRGNCEGTENNWGGRKEMATSYGCRKHEIFKIMRRRWSNVFCLIG